MNKLEGKLRAISDMAEAQCEAANEANEAAKGLLKEHSGPRVVVNTTLVDERIDKRFEDMEQMLKSARDEGRAEGFNEVEALRRASNVEDGHEGERLEFERCVREGVERGVAKGIEMEKERRRKKSLKYRLKAAIGMTSGKKGKGGAREATPRGAQGRHQVGTVPPGHPAASRVMKRKSHRVMVSFTRESRRRSTRPTRARPRRGCLRGGDSLLGRLLGCLFRRLLGCLLGCLLGRLLGRHGGFLRSRGSLLLLLLLLLLGDVSAWAPSRRVSRVLSAVSSPAAAAPRFTPACFEPPSPPSPFFCTPGTNAVVRPPTVMNEMAFPPIFPATFPHRRWKSQSLGKRSASAPARHAVSTTCPIARRTSRSCAAESVRAEASGCILAW